MLKKYTLTRINGIFQVDDMLAEELDSATDICYFPIKLGTNLLHKSLEFRSTEAGKAVFATQALESGTIVVYATGSRINRPLRYSRQIDDYVHIVGVDGVDHHCTDPSLAVDPDSNNLVARRLIVPDEKVTFNYLTTEWDIVHPFPCDCNGEGCYKSIEGFRHLTTEQKNDLAQTFPIAHYLLKYIDPEIRKQQGGLTEQILN